MRFSAAAHETHWMFLVQHLVVENVGDHARGNVWPVKLTVNHDQVQRRVKAAKLGSPGSPTPGQSRLSQRIIEILVIQLAKERFEIVARPGRSMLDFSRAELPQNQESASC